MESRYSTFLEDAKKQILKFWTVIKGKQISGASFILKIKQILYKDKKLREEIEKNLGVKIADEAELGNFVELNSETINLNEYK
jgi:hypothetical protein